MVRHMLKLFPCLMIYLFVLVCRMGTSLSGKEYDAPRRSSVHFCGLLMLLSMCSTRELVYRTTCPPAVVVIVKNCRCLRCGLRQWYVSASCSRLSRRRLRSLRQASRDESLHHHFSCFNLLLITLLARCCCAAHSATSTRLANDRCPSRSVVYSWFAKSC